MKVYVCLVRDQRGALLTYVGPSRAEAEDSACSQVSPRAHGVEGPGVFRCMDDLSRYATVTEHEV